MEEYVPQAIYIAQRSIMIVLLISAPPLLTALLVGVVISVLQTATQIQEMTLTFIPKVVAVLGVFFFMMPWMMMKLIDYTQELFGQMSHAFTGGGI